MYFTTLNGVQDTAGRIMNNIIYGFMLFYLAIGILSHQT
jgi:hypothetical protein